MVTPLMRLFNCSYSTKKHICQGASRVYVGQKPLYRAKGPSALMVLVRQSTAPRYILAPSALMSRAAKNEGGCMLEQGGILCQLHVLLMTSKGVDTVADTSPDILLPRICGPNPSFVPRIRMTACLV